MKKLLMTEEQRKREKKEVAEVEGKKNVQGYESS